MKDEYVSVEHLVLAMLDDRQTAAGRVLDEHGVTRERLLEALTRGPRQPARDERDAGGRLRGAREVRPRPRRRGARAASWTR